MGFSGNDEFHSGGCLFPTSSCVDVYCPPHKRARTSVIIKYQLEFFQRNAFLRSLVGFLMAINIKGLLLNKFLEHQETNCGWILEKSHGKGQLIVLPHNEFNHPELKKNTVDSILLEHITRIFPILS
ncbi:hypothetical protein ACOSQ4_001860 [Xanthoceras sorbifolium]